ncbi:MAG: hypothetical protein Q8P80_04320 [Candidatus Levybacteria bacterium]|nr:hypothetical protein [Candidatus Levybacteria bacterium]
MSKLLNATLIISIFFLLTLGFFHKITAITQDLGRHLKTGEIILSTGSVPKVNLFSYTFSDFPFINHHWFSEVIFYKIFQATGFNGLLILTTILILTAFGLIFFQTLRKASLIPLSLVSVLYLKILFERTDLRPEIFSFLFLSVFITVLYKNKEKFTRWIFILPVIELLWVNVHIYFPVGIIVLVLFIFDALISELRRTVRQTTQNLPGKLTILIAVLIFSSIAIIINPNGINGALYPLHVFQNYGYAVEENQNIFFLWQYFQKPTVPYFVIAVIFLFTALLLNFKKTKLIDWLLSIFFTIFAITAVRNFPLFVFATFAPLAINLSALSENILVKVEPLSRLNLVKNISLFFIFVLIFWQTIQIIQTKKVGFGVETGAKNAADFFIKENLKGPIFNNFDIGSYLDYRLFPKEKVFIDGRPEAYPSGFFQKTYIPMQNSMDIFNKVSRKYNFNTIFFAHTDQTPWANTFLKEIIKNKNWKIIYLDDYVIILTKDNIENKTIIKKFEIKENSFEIDNNMDFDSLTRFAVFFNKIGWQSQEENTYQRMLSLNPNFCPALYNLYILLAGKNDQTAYIYLNRFNYSCK